MPQAKRSTTATTRRPRALNRLEKSIDAAESALEDLRGELGRGGRDLVKDLEKTLRDSRKNLRSLRRTVAKDIQKLQRAATTKRPAAAPGRRAGAPQTKTKRTSSSSAKK